MLRIKDLHTANWTSIAFFSSTSCPLNQSHPSHLYLNPPPPFLTPTPHHHHHHHRHNDGIHSLDVVCDLSTLFLFFFCTSYTQPLLRCRRPSPLQSFVPACRRHHLLPSSAALIQSLRLGDHRHPSTARTALTVPGGAALETIRRDFGGPFIFLLLILPFSLPPSLSYFSWHLALSARDANQGRQQTPALALMWVPWPVNDSQNWASVGWG